MMNYGPTVANRSTATVSDLASYPIDGLPRSGERGTLETTRERFRSVRLISRVGSRTAADPLSTAYRRQEEISQPDAPSVIRKRSLLVWLDKIRLTPEAERQPSAVWPTDEAFEDARAFIQELPMSSIPSPNMGLADDGEVNFLWRVGGVYVDLGFYGTGVYSYFAQSRDEQEYSGENIPAIGGLPDEVVALFAD